MIRVYLGIFAAIFFWGSAFVGISIALEGYSPESLALGRGLIASFIAFLLYRRKKQSYCLRSRIKAALLGSIGIGLYSLFLNIGEKTVPAGVAGFIVAQLSLLACILATIFLKEKISSRLWTGIGVSILGLALIMFGDPQGLSIGPGVFFVILSTLSGAIYTCFQKPVLKNIPTLAFTCHAIWGGTLFLILYSLFNRVPFITEFSQASIKPTLSLIYLGCCPSVLAYFGWSYAISKVSISKVGIFFYGMPVIGGLLAWLILKEMPTSMSMFGMALALCGSLIGTLNLRPKRATSSLKGA